MPERLDRRHLLRASATLAAGIGATLAITSPANAAVADPTIPEVPGMKGDPRANEFWFQYDRVFFFEPSAELGAAFAAIVGAVGGPRTWRPQWMAVRGLPDYRARWAELWRPVRAELALLSREQLRLFDNYYHARLLDVVSAFEDMAMGTLYDPRRGDGQKLHTMDPPNTGTEAYHRWHVIIRAQIFLGVDALWWSAIDRLVGLAWAVQSIARPVRDSPDNPRLPDDQLGSLRLTWLSRDGTELDQAFETFPFPAAA